MWTISLKQPFLKNYNNRKNEANFIDYTMTQFPRKKNASKGIERSLGTFSWLVNVVFVKKYYYLRNREILRNFRILRNFKLRKFM